MGKVMTNYFKISDPNRNILLSTFGVLIKLVSSLTSKPRELDRVRPYFHAYWYWNQKGSRHLSILLTCDIPFIFYDDIAKYRRRSDRR